MRVSGVYRAMLVAGALCGLAAGCVEIRDLSRPLPEPSLEGKAASEASGMLWTRPSRHNTDVIVLIHAADLTGLTRPLREAFDEQDLLDAVRDLGRIYREHPDARVESLRKAGVIEVA